MVVQNFSMFSIKEFRGENILNNGTMGGWQSLMDFSKNVCDMKSSNLGPQYRGLASQWISFQCQTYVKAVIKRILFVAKSALSVLKRHRKTLFKSILILAQILASATNRDNWENFLLDRCHKRIVPQQYNQQKKNGDVDFRWQKKIIRFLIEKQKADKKPKR